MHLIIDSVSPGKIVFIKWGERIEVAHHQPVFFIRILADSIVEIRLNLFQTVSVAIGGI